MKPEVVVTDMVDRAIEAVIGFYERNGWRRFGEIPCDPPGTSRIFMTNEL
jgi:hypothetical protein